MTQKYLLDSTLLFDVLATGPGDHKSSRRLESLDELFISTTALGELYYLAFQLKDSERFLEALDRFQAEASLLSPDAETARHYGQFRSELFEREGSSLTINSGWLRLPFSMD
jgi:predicted nucleic acid-binding protein